MLVLVLIDRPTFFQLASGVAPSSKFSHDRHIFQFAHEALRQGMEVIATSMQDEPFGREYRRVLGVYPLWQTGETLTFGEIAPDIVVSVFPESLNVRPLYPKAKIISIHAAVHWAESPETFSAHYVYDLITAIRHNTDVILTQNHHMKSLLEATYGLLARWRYPERILVCPLSIVEEERKRSYDRRAARAAMQLGEDEVAIINSGGIWRWTDFNTLLAAFCAHCEEVPQTRLRLFISGFRQPGNTIHDDYHVDTLRILGAHKGLIGRTVIPENIWSQGSRIVDVFSAGADVGLNISQDSLEHWQSYRVRFLEYITQGLPVINSTGDAMSSGEAAAGMFTVRPGDLAGYRAVLRDIENDPGQLETKAAALRRIAPSFDSRRTYGEAIRRIVELPRREDGDTAAWGPCVLDFADDRARESAAAGVRRRLETYLTEGLEPA